MKLKKIALIFSVLTLVCGMFPVNVQAQTASDLKQQEVAAKNKAEKIDKQINNILAIINEKYIELADLEVEVTQSKAKIAKTKEEISTTKKTIEKRRQTAAERMRSLQLNGTQVDGFNALLAAENMSDFLTRMYAISMIQGAENDKVDALVKEQEKLEKLEQTLEKTQQELIQQEASIKSEQTALDTQMSSLQATYEANKNLLSHLTAQRVAEEAEERQAAEQAAKEKAAKEQAAKEAQAAKESDASHGNNNSNTSSGADSSTNTGSGNQGSGSTTPPPPVEEKPETPTPPVEETPAPPINGMLTGHATAYIATGNKTATGTVPTPGRTIAVDPSVIPLGSLVQIVVPGKPQYNGVYRAEDTGGAVKGHIIDIFVGSLEEARQFGRQTIKFKVL